jgi:hypothetical protein
MLSREEWLSIGRGAMIAIGGSLAAWGTTFLIPFLQGTGDPKLLFLASALMVAINIARKSSPHLFGGTAPETKAEE